MPGRLNDLRHIIYKAADAPWRRARRNLGLMMREGLLKENIDGEALLWAHARLIGAARAAPHPDGDFRWRAGGRFHAGRQSGNYLEEHLRAVIEWIEKASEVELIAIGIGHDVTRYYQPRRHHCRRRAPRRHDDGEAPRNCLTSRARRRVRRDRLGCGRRRPMNWLCDQAWRSSPPAPSAADAPIEEQWRAIEVQARPVSFGEPAHRLRFRGGPDLTSTMSSGGLSGLEALDDNRFIAESDDGHWSRRAGSFLDADMALTGWPMCATAPMRDEGASHREKQMPIPGTSRTSPTALAVSLEQTKPHHLLSQPRRAVRRGDPVRRWRASSVCR